MKITNYHAKYFAYELIKRCSSDSIEKLTTSLLDAQIDSNPHQIDAALFAFKSPLSKGAILADEVGLGKTIEAGLVISQKWAERKRKILIIVPSNLRKQWNQELLEKFFLPSIILEAPSFNQETKKGKPNPFEQKEIVICSYHFARAKEAYLRLINWDLVVIDEAHRLRNVYKPTNKIGNAIKNALENTPKLLLTATPLQNSLLELYGLVSIIDDYTFGDLKSFRTQYGRLNGGGNFEDLKERLKPVCKRTLRRQVREYISYTDRHAIIERFTPTESEQRLYNLVSEYLQRPNLYALPSSQRQLITLILRKLLASSTYAISGTLEALVARLDGLVARQECAATLEEALGKDFEEFSELKEEWIESNDQEPETDALTNDQLNEVRDEADSLREFYSLAIGIITNSKGQALLTALQKGFEWLHEKGGNRKALIFTESIRTQQYLQRILEGAGFLGKILLFNGSNNDPESRRIYQGWLAKHRGTDKVTGSKTADMRAALVDYFRNEAEIMIATEAAAEGINLQFCSLVVNYDLPWNPQRIEQRIGRCHRYGQKHDVVVVNFLNEKNAADQRVYQLLDEKFKLFSGVFGASDEVLGSIESGVDFEKRIAEIYQCCRTEIEIQQAFDKLQHELESQIDEGMKQAQQKLLENFDEEVTEKLRLNQEKSRDYLNKYENWLWALTRYYLEPYADFSTAEHSFTLRKNPFAGETIHPGPYRVGRKINDANVYRVNHPLAQRIIEQCKTLDTPDAELIFDLTGRNIGALAPLRAKSGWLAAINLTVTTFETEDYVVVAGLAADGEALDDEQFQRLFTLAAEIQALNKSDYPANLDVMLNERRQRILDDLIVRNAQYFEVELDKLDRWGEDQRNSLKETLKELEDQIKELRKAARLAPNLPEKLRLEREKRNLETRRDEAWREYDLAAKEIERNKDKLIDEVESRLEQNIDEVRLFTIRWRVI